MKRQVADALNEELIKSGKHIAYTQTLLRANAKVSDPAVVQVVARENKKAEVVAGPPAPAVKSAKRPAKRKATKKAKVDRWAKAATQKGEVIVGKDAKGKPIMGKFEDKPAKKSAKKPAKKASNKSAKKRARK